MSAIVIDGKAIAEKIRRSFEKELKAFRNLRLGILCPDHKPSRVYLGTIQKLAISLGLEVHIVICTQDMTQEYLELLIRKWNTDPDAHGIFILQPFLQGKNLERLAMLINPLKDIECIHPYNSTLRYFSKSPIGSCTALAVMEILDFIGTNLEGKEAIVVGHSKIVGRPLSMLLLDRNATVTVCHKSTSDRFMLESHVRRAEILIVAAGQAECMLGKWVKSDAIVIDVGVNDINGKTVGDVGFDEACKRASYITPCRGGVGPVTAMVGMRQLVTAYHLQRDKR